MSELMEVSFFLCFVMDDTLIFEFFLPIKIRVFWKWDGLMKSYRYQRYVLYRDAVLKELL